MDLIAMVIFPSRKYATATLVFYTFVLIVGLTWYTSNWLAIPAVILCMVFAWMLLTWFF